MQPVKSRLPQLRKPKLVPAKMASVLHLFQALTLGISERNNSWLRRLLSGSLQSLPLSPSCRIRGICPWLSMIGHGILILVSIYLPPTKELLRSDLEALFALRDVVIVSTDDIDKAIGSIPTTLGQWSRTALEHFQRNLIAESCLEMLVIRDKNAAFS
ncbi:hypothetical protein EVAR_86399_1 [Eumeta japonica]|uniref:Uncharacterized protein n=1 Tax=Eumeta variegata TaxID=151549 RepID=A0A4C1W9B9_EUMVA|nr:hypothetical protein EVAR_86399_1 [Eumeta japonica]